MIRAFENLAQAQSTIDEFKNLIAEEGTVYIVESHYDWYGNISGDINDEYRIQGMVVTVDEYGVDIDVFVSDGRRSSWESTDYTYGNYADAKEHLDNI